MVGRWFDSWAEKRLAILVAVASAGVASEWMTSGPVEPTRWLADLATGVSVAACGVVAMRRNRGTGWLLVGVAVAWFAANVWPDTALLHRALLVQAIVCFPGWRPRTPLRAGVVALAYFEAFVPARGTAGTAVVVLSIVVASCWWALATAPPSTERQARAGLLAALAIWTSAVVIALQRSGIVPMAPTATVLLYEACLVVSATVLMLALHSEQRSVLDVVVDLGEDHSSTLRDALSAALGDPLLRLGFWDGERYRDADGSAVDRGALEPSRHATCIDLDGQPEVIIVHDAATLRDTSLVDAVAVATRLSGEHAALQRVVELQRTDLVESRQRLLGAADDERRALDDQLRGGAERHLMGVADLLREDLSVAQRCARWERMRQLLDGVIDDLGRLSAGLHPRIIERGVRDALTELAGGSPLPVRLKVHASVADDEHCTTIYYVCAEALSNAVKHASCRSVTIDLAASDDATTLRIADDGRGGIDPDIGSGLRGLIDRVESVGGRISFAGDAGGSTIAVMLPRHGSGSTVMVPAAGHDRDRPMWRTSHDVPIDDDPYVRTNSPEEVWT